MDKYYVLSRDNERQIVFVNGDNDPLYGNGSWNLESGPHATFEIAELHAALAAAEQSECDAIKHMAAAMEKLKQRDHAAIMLDTLVSWYDDDTSDPAKMDYLMDMARDVLKGNVRTA